MPIDPRFRFSGAAATARQPRTDQVSVTSARRIVPGVARGGESTTEIDADAVLRVELENGFVLWSRADDLMHERGQRSVGRDGDAFNHAFSRRRGARFLNNRARFARRGYGA